MPKEVFDQTGGWLSLVVRSLLRVISEPGKCRNHRNRFANAELEGTRTIGNTSLTTPMSPSRQVQGVVTCCTRMSIHTSGTCIMLLYCTTPHSLIASVMHYARGGSNFVLNSSCKTLINLISRASLSLRLSCFPPATIELTLDFNSCL